MTVLSDQKIKINSHVAEAHLFVLFALHGWLMVWLWDKIFSYIPCLQVFPTVILGILGNLSEYYPYL